MKTTSYEISKKLAQTNFSHDASFYWVKPKGKKAKLSYFDEEFFVLKDTEVYSAYDLETIIEALPKEIIYKKTKGIFEINFDGDFGNFYYVDLDESNQKLLWQDFCPSTEQEENESLADTAARLLLLLVEKKLIKFNNE